MARILSLATCACCRGMALSFMSNGILHLISMACTDASMAVDVRSGIPELTLDLRLLSLSCSVCSSGRL